MTDWMGRGSPDGHKRALTLAVAVGLFAVVFVLLVLVDAPAEGVGFLYVLPVGLVAVELGWRWGLTAAALAFAMYVAWSLLADVDLSALGYATRAFVLFLLGGVLGQLGARARATGEESKRWFAMATDLLATASLEGRFTHLNPAWERTLGWTGAELMSRPYLEFVHPDDVEPTLAVAGALLERSSRAVGFENRYATKDGGWRWLLWSEYSDGRQIYAVGKDITERKRLEAEREELLERVEAMARTDALTGLPNRRSWEEELRREVARAERQGHALAVVMLDLDRFKDFNDRHGHQAGDRLLAEIGGVWRTQLRVSDFVARYGGEEFAALLPACPPDEAIVVLERMRLAIPDGQTCSAGVAYWDEQESPEALIGRADAALYQAKGAGRDRIVTAS
jgi:diguanylate cyclase (GGDEF)-like protein/PAS domain S-box-containing protein